jgi:hypothetical protein
MIKFISTAYQTWPEKLQTFSEITMENDLWLLILRNYSQWKIVQWSRRSCIPVWNFVYYICLFLKFSQCKFEQKETILKLGNTQKQVKIHQIKNRLGCFHLHPLLGLYTETTGGLLTLGRIFSPSIILKSPPIKICSENTERKRERDF